MCLFPWNYHLENKFQMCGIMCHKFFFSHTYIHTEYQKLHSDSLDVSLISNASQWSLCRMIVPKLLNYEDLSVEINSVSAKRTFGTLFSMKHSLCMRWMLLYEGLCIDPHCYWTYLIAWLQMMCLHFNIGRLQAYNHKDVHGHLRISHYWTISCLLCKTAPCILIEEGFVITEWLLLSTRVQEGEKEGSLTKTLKMNAYSDLFSHYVKIIWLVDHLFWAII